MSNVCLWDTYICYHVCIFEILTNTPPRMWTRSFYAKSHFSQLICFSFLFYYLLHVGACVMAFPMCNKTMKTVWESTSITSRPTEHWHACSCKKPSCSGLDKLTALPVGWWIPLLMDWLADALAVFVAVRLACFKAGGLAGKGILWITLVLAATAAAGTRHQ